MALLVTAAARADEPPRPSPAVVDDFKLVIEMFGPGKTPVASAQIVVRRGVGYQFLPDVPWEVVVIDPASSSVGLVDIRRKVQTEVSSRRLDAATEALRARLTRDADARAKSASRSDKLIASVARDLIEPAFKETFDPATGALRLTNPTVEVDAVGVAESDRSRFLMVTNCLAAVAKLGALRDPDNLPPFTRLDALARLAAAHGLRPAEMSYLYHLPGKPRRLRWTYQVVTTLTAREVEAINRLNTARATIPFVPYDRYEEEDDEEP